MAERHWTPTMVEDRLEEAADTLRRLPDGQKPQTHMSAWPAVLRDFWEVYGQERPRLRLPPPHPAAIDRLDQTLAWLAWLETDEVRLVWLRAERVRWKAICWRFGVSRTTAWRNWVAALVKIAARLNAEQELRPRRLRPG